MMKPMILALFSASVMLPAEPTAQQESPSGEARFDEIEHLYRERFERAKHAAREREKLEREHLRESRKLAWERLNVAPDNPRAMALDHEFQMKGLELRSRYQRELLAIEQEFDLGRLDRAIARLETRPAPAPRIGGPAGVAPEAAGQPSPSTKIDDDFNGARARAAAEGKPLLVHFTGHTNIASRQFEVTVLDTLAFAEHLEPFVTARLYSDAADQNARTDNERRAEEVAKTPATPTFVIVDPRSGDALARARGAPEKEDFIRFLDEGLAAFETPVEPATEVSLWRAIFELEDEVRSLRKELANERDED